MNRIRSARFCGASVLVCLVLATALQTFAAVEPNLSRPNPIGTPTTVQISLYLADLYDISGSDETFLADVVLQAKWLDARLAGRSASVSGADLNEVWNPRLQLVNDRGVTALLPRRIEVDPSGLVTYRQRWFGRFAGHMDLKDFPLDRQHFRVQVVSLGYPRGEVDLVINSENLRFGRATELFVADWEIGPARMEIADYEPAPGVNALAGTQLRWDARRYFGYYAVQVILPLAFIVLMGWTALWVDPTVIAARVSVSMTAMLTLIAYRFALGKSIPNLTYLTRFDWFMLASTVLVFLILLFVAAGAHLVVAGKTPLVHRIDRWARLVFPALFAVVLVLAWWT